MTWRCYHDNTVVKNVPFDQAILTRVSCLRIDPKDNTSKTKKECYKYAFSLYKRLLSLGNQEKAQSISFVPVLFRIKPEEGSEDIALRYDPLLPFLFIHGKEAALEKGLVSAEQFERIKKKVLTVFGKNRKLN